MITSNRDESSPYFTSKMGQLVNYFSLQALDFAPQSVSLRVSYLRLLVDAAETSQDLELAWVEVELQFLKAVTSVGHQHNSRDLWDIVTKYSKNIQSLRDVVKPEDLGYFVMESGSVMWSAVIASMKSQDAPAWKLEEMYQRWRLVEWQSTEFWHQYLQWLKTQGSGSVNKVSFVIYSQGLYLLCKFLLSESR